MIKRVFMAVSICLLAGLGGIASSGQGLAQEEQALPWQRSAAVLPVRLERLGGQARLVFDWSLPVAAAVFERAGILWVVFDEPGQVDMVALRTAVQGHLVPLSINTDAKSLVLRFEVTGDLKIGVQRDDNRWQIALSDPSGRPEHLIPLGQAETSRQGVRAFVPLDGPGLHLKISDPLAGGVLHIVPVLQASAGVASAVGFGKFEILASAQGFVIAGVADDIEVARYANGVAVGSISLLGASAPPLPAGAGLVSVMDRETAPGRIIDLGAWRLGNLQKFNPNQRMLNRRLAGASESERNGRRWDLARFYLAHSMYLEARAYLDIIVSADASWADKPRYKAVRALVEADLGNYAPAIDLIASPELDAEPEIALVRSGILAAGGWHQQALVSFETGREGIALFAPREAVDLRLAAFGAAIETGRLEVAGREAVALGRLPLDKSQQASADYLEGRLHELRGAVPEAMALYASVAKSGRRPASGKARLALIELGLARQRLEVPDAIEALESLRYSWRGDPFELQLAAVLGRLYLGQANLRDGLAVMRRAVVQFPGHPRSQALTREMSQAFQRLFVEGAIENLDALSTLALYAEFRELTPLGPDGDRLIRQLAEKLVALDLLDQAAGLLSHQVRFRSEGAAQAATAARLAEIYVLDREPAAALEVLEQTNRPGFPADVIRARNLVGASAWLLLAQYAEAEAAIRSDRGSSAEEFRAEIFWRQGRWPELIRASNRLLAPKIGSREPLAEGDRLLLIRHALALAISDQPAALATLRRDFAEAMKIGPLSNAFEIITQPTNSAAGRLRDVVTVTASVKLLQEFMSQYRQNFGLKAGSGGQ